LGFRVIAARWTDRSWSNCHISHSSIQPRVVAFTIPRGRMVIVTIVCNARRFVWIYRAEQTKQCQTPIVQSFHTNCLDCGIQGQHDSRPRSLSCLLDAESQTLPPQSTRIDPHLSKAHAVLFNNNPPVFRLCNAWERHDSSGHRQPHCIGLDMLGVRPPVAEILKELG
jgi:hypothetical protein